MQKWDNKEVIVVIPGKALLKQPSTSLCETLFFFSSSSSLPLHSKLSLVSSNPFLALKKRIFLLQKKSLFPKLSLCRSIISHLLFSCPSFPNGCVSSLLNCPLCTKQLTHRLLFFHFKSSSSWLLKNSSFINCFLSLLVLSNCPITTRNMTFSHKFFGHEYNFISKDDIRRRNLSLLRKFVSKVLIECKMRPNYLWRHHNF